MPVFVFRLKACLYCMIFVLVYVGCSYYQPTANQTGEIHRMLLLSFDVGLKQYDEVKNNRERKSSLFCIFLWPTSRTNNYRSETSLFFL